MKNKFLILIASLLISTNLFAQSGGGSSQDVIINILFVAVGILIIVIAFALLRIFHQLVVLREDEIFEKHNIKKD